MTWFDVIHKHEEVFLLNNFKHFKRNEHKKSERIARRRRAAQSVEGSPLSPNTLKAIPESPRLYFDLTKEERAFQH